MHESSSAAAVHGARGDNGLRRLIIRPAKRRDLVAFFGRVPRPTINAEVVLIDDEVVGVVGLARERAVSQFFSETKPALTPYLRTMPILRLIKRSMQVVDNHVGLVYALADDNEGRRLLRRLGFSDEGEYFLWLN